MSAQRRHVEFRGSRCEGCLRQLAASADRTAALLRHHTGGQAASGTQLRRCTHRFACKGAVASCILAGLLGGVTAQPLYGAEGSLASATAERLYNVRADFDQALAEFDEAQAIRTEQPARARQLFRSAAQRFRIIQAVGPDRGSPIVNGRLEFNLGNCYLQSGDIGKAVLHYRRAQRLIPGDPMLADNLSGARSQCLTVIRPTRRSAVLRNLLFWHYQTSSASRTKAALVFYTVFWGLLILRNAIPQRRNSRLTMITVFVLFSATFAAASAGSVAVERWADRNAPAGVVTAMDVVVRKGPGDGFQRLFEQPLQPGVEFTLRQKTARGWWKLELADGKSGWIETRQAELVPVDKVGL